MYNKEKLARGLTLAADILAQEVRNLAVSEKYPSVAAPSVTVGIAQVDDVGGKIAITSEGVADKYGYSPYIFFVIYEQGTGIHGPGGSKYTISPRDGKSVLKFMFPQAMNIGPGSPPGSVAKSVTNAEGLAYLPSVQHPGVKAKPILLQAIQNKQAQMLGIIGQNLEFKIFDGPRVEIIR